MQLALRSVALCLFAAFPLAASAFESAGHQQVGAIADKLIQDSNAAKEVKNILGGLNLQTVAVWADCAKGVSSLDDRIFKYVANPASFPECDAFNSAEDKARFESYAQRNWKQCGTAHGSEYCHNQYHYTDVASLHSGYQNGYVGTHDHDVVHAISAAVAVLRDQAPAKPFSIADKKEALMLLTHYVGDIHQPLHVAALYLDANGQAIDPDVAGYKLGNDTVGGNSLMDGVESLHREWDAIPSNMNINGPDPYGLLDTAKNMPATAGDISTWPATWATESIAVGKDAFFGLRFTLKPDTYGSDENAPHKWNVAGIDANYKKRADDVKAQQVAKAGARLAQTLKAIWPDSPAMGDAPKPVSVGAPGYLPVAQLPDVRQWLPLAPTKGGAAEAADIAVFNATRPILHSIRGQQAAEDDVFDPALVIERFKDAIGASLTPANAPTLISLIKKAQADGSNLVAPIKLELADGGRVRPFVAFAGTETCLDPIDMAHHRDVDINTWHLDQTGSYPSTHALVGMLVGMILSEAAPDRADAVLGRGFEFGESRVICGFHYASDVAAGRLVAAALFARLHAEPAFVKDMARTKKELIAARKPAPKPARQRQCTIHRQMDCLP